MIHHAKIIQEGPIWPTNYCRDLLSKTENYQAPMPNDVFIASTWENTNAETSILYFCGNGTQYCRNQAVSDITIFYPHLY